MIIGLTGRIAAGKGVVKDYFMKLGFQYATFSDAVRKEAMTRGIEITREKLQDLGDEIRKKEGAGAWAKRLLADLDLNKNIVVDGIRNPGEISELRKHKDFFLISVDAPQKIRFNRVLSRAKPSDPKTWKDFLLIDERDFGDKTNLLGQQVGACMNLANFKIVNDNLMDHTLGQIQEIWNKINY
jgi:dephospho-CoA kinase